MKHRFILVLVGLFLASCHHDCEPEKNCVSETLEENNMVPYTGQELGCGFFLTLFDFHGKQYFVLNNHCADLIDVSPFDCDGNRLCTEGETEECSSFAEEAEYIGIVGIRVP